MQRAAATASTEAALRGLFDHAGMFPPAQKPLADALADAAGFPRSLARPGIVGADLVLPWSQWSNLTTATLDKAGFRGTCKVALVGLDLAALPAAIAVVSTAPPRIRVVSLEASFEGAPAPESWPSAPSGIQLFLEPKWMPNQWTATAAEALCRNLRERGFGLKVRCAGPTAVDAKALAAIVRAATDAGIPVKATQGLHHPVATTQHPHGFVALTAAVRLRQALGARFDDIEACLAAPSAAAFDLRDGIRWGHHHVAADRLAALPSFAIGSCSLTEPDDDLAACYGAPGGPA